MKIYYQPNPLDTKVELDDHDIEILRLKLIIEYLKNRIYDADYNLEPGEHFNPEFAKKELNASRLEKDKHIDEQLEWMISELKSSHCGDCTCVPSSCLKCHAESLLGIDTISGLETHSAHKIKSAFINDRTIDEVIEILDNYSPKRSGSWLSMPEENFENCVPKWKEEAKKAVKWLREYRANILER